MEPEMTADVVAARRGLHAVAERLLAGPQWRATGKIGLAVTADGFRTTRAPGPQVDELRVRVVVFRGEGPSPVAAMIFRTTLPMPSAT